MASAKETDATPIKPPQPIIIIKRKKWWKAATMAGMEVAYADFVTAMMSLFIVLWLMGADDEIKKAVTFTSTTLPETAR